MSGMLASGFIALVNMIVAFLIIHFTPETSRGQKRKPSK
jgi:hypothetical protein